MGSAVSRAFQGAAAGSSLGPVGAVIGGGLGLAAGLSEADAARKEAQAQQDIANAQLREQRATREQALKFAAPSEMEIKQLESAVQANQQDIARTKRILDATDPAIIEAGQQTLALLKGQEAKTLDPIRRARARQEQALKDRLQAQLGPGWENSSAGIQAMQEFAMQTDTLLAQEQDRTLGRLLGVSQGFSAQGLGNQIAQAGSLASLRGNINARQVSALTGTPITAAGAQFTGNLVNARNQMNQSAQFMNTLGSMGQFAFAQQGAASPTAKPGSVNTQVQPGTMGVNYMPNFGNIG